MCNFRINQNQSSACMFAILCENVWNNNDNGVFGFHFVHQSWTTTTARTSPWIFPSKKSRFPLQPGCQLVRKVIGWRREDKTALTWQIFCLKARFFHRYTLFLNGLPIKCILSFFFKNLLTYSIAFVNL